MKLIIITTVVALFAQSSYGMGSRRNKDLLNRDFKEVSSIALEESNFKGSRNLDFLSGVKTATITIGKKQFEQHKDKVFVDGHGRETYFKGWNMSNRSKGDSFGFKPFKDAESARVTIAEYKKRTGSNIIRWLFSWSGAQPNVGKIDEKYFDEQALQIREAIKLGMYILVDFHQDTFSTHIKGGANGAPKWVVDGMTLPGKQCPSIVEKLCKHSWAVSYVVNKDVISSLEQFWNNETIKTDLGPLKVQDEFVKMVEAGIKRLKKALGDDFKYIVGLDPWNEPHYGGFSRRGKTRKWLNDKLFPFYHNIRSSMDKAGWENKLLFSEPHMMWNLKLPITLQLGSGTGLLKNPPKDNRWVFNTHFYDETRESVGITPVKNGAYLKSSRKIREEARNWNMPAIVTEFGTWHVGGSERRQKASDPLKNIKATYQAFDLSKTSKKSHRYADFYSPYLSRVQWAWEDENSGTIPKSILAYDRAYPKKIQGELMSFYYNDTVRSSFDNSELNWVGLRPSGNKKEKPLFAKNKFIFMAWRGRKSDAPTEVYLPKHFKVDKTLLITDKKIIKGIDHLSMDSKGISDEVLLFKEENHGSKLFIFDDLIGEDQNSMHFALVVELSDMNEVNASQIHGQLIELMKRKNSPLYFLGKFKIDNPLIK